MDTAVEVDSIVAGGGGGGDGGGSGGCGGCGGCGGWFHLKKALHDQIKKYIKKSYTFLRIICLPFGLINLHSSGEL